jgi:photosystem II stability/assembly factor-like uncharacterized protein
MMAVAPVAGGLVAVGRSLKTGDAFDAAVWRSRDGGASWERIARDLPALGGPGNQTMKGVVQFGDRLVAVGWSGDNGAVWTSTDGGDSWKRVPANALSTTPGHGLELLGVDIVGGETSGPRLVAVGRESVLRGRSAAAAWYSDDGQAWSRATIRNARFSGQQMTAVAAGSDGLLAVGNASDGGAGVWRSSDGAEWSAVASKSFRPPAGMTSVALLGDGNTVAVGTAIWDGPAP